MGEDLFKIREDNVEQFNEYFNIIDDLLKDLQQSGYESELWDKLKISISLVKNAQSLEHLNVAYHTL